MLDFLTAYFEIQERIRIEWSIACFIFPQNHLKNLDTIFNFHTSQFSDSPSTLTSYDPGFAREMIRLEKDVLSKLGVSSKSRFIL